MKSFVLEFFITARFVNLAVSLPQYQFAHSGCLSYCFSCSSAHFFTSPRILLLESGEVISRSTFVLSN
jgi:hypothetical protein